MKITRIAFVLIIALTFSGCGLLGPGNVATGIGRVPGQGAGVVSNVDPLNNGLYQIWFFGDTTYVYCTLDASLAKAAQDSLHQPGDRTVYYTYRDWKAGDPEYDDIDGAANRISTTCGQLVKGAQGSKLLTLVLVNK